MSEETDPFVIEIAAGASRTLRIITTRPDGTPLNLTSGTALWTFSRHSRSSADSVLFQKTCIIDVVEIAGSQFHRVSTDLFPEDTINLEPRTYWHECWAKTNSDKPYRVGRGIFRVMPSVGADL